MLPPPPRSTLFPYTTLFRSDVHDRRYLLVNRVAEAQFGISRELIIGKTTSDIFPKAAADIIAADEEKTLLSRSEEHTSELQSRLHLVCRLLLEKKKKQKIIT